VHPQRLAPPLLLSATEDDIDIHGDPEAIWPSWVAGDLRRRPIHSGHHQAEDAPDEVAGRGPRSSVRVLGQGDRPG
jgi:hypothetical protein